ncbi:phosphoribosylformylglycinamidine synthase subunit PurQ [Verrucomicrobiales bacterium]|nr:phosphoribosylformylglycinamidine synthase subunit PurQ [Verrucomicrobiales bacterium]
MATRPNALLLKFPGTNADEETARALREVGFEARTVPITRVTVEDFADTQLGVLSGGFSYGDYVMAARFAQLEIERRLGDTLTTFRDKGGHLLGICNGFQTLMRLGILPPGSLVDNVSERFVCKWVPLEKKVSDSPFLHTLPEGFELPIAHGEGRLVTKDPADAETYMKDGLAALTYGEDVNGSYQQIAGLQDTQRRVLGLMPHPERFIYREQHYDRDWQQAEHGWGYYLFKSIYQTVTA